MSEVPARHEDRAGERAWRALPAGTREALERGLPPTDLQTLLIAVARKRARRVSAANVMRRWQSDRFVRPATADPRHGGGQPGNGHVHPAACHRRLRA